MANYTIELRQIVEMGYNIFDFPYLFYDEKKRQDFEQKFIRHFYFREIGCETVDRFKLYLQDKMQTVFPYYNELFKTALIEYDKVNNYDMTETMKRDIKNNGKNSAVSSTVAQLFNEQTAESNQNKTVDITGNLDANEANTEHETATGTSNTLRNETVDTDTTNSSITDISSTKKGTGKTTTTENVTKKFLDTPQGAVNMNDTRYITTLNDDASTAITDATNNETFSSTDTVSGSTTSDTQTTATDETTTANERDNEKSATTSQTTTGNETTADNVTSKVNDEQKSTQDNNTRNYSEGEQNEEYELRRYGNIGIQTASDMIEKHIKLQKVLQRIELMFFEECEDLFMMVF